MDKVILFIALSIPLIYISKHSLFEFKSHGFTRFWSWECITALFVINHRHWFTEPFSVTQVISWLLLIISLWFVIEGALLLRKARKPGIVRVDEKLFRFEQTTELVTNGIYKYIRHPLYSSLLLLTWGIWFKQPGVITALIGLLSSVLLWYTARRDEQECLAWFGEEYREYMTRTKRLIPFVL
jgi:protein-S-isoprenylcysteine O-methyltransferase Ste14